MISETKAFYIMFKEKSWNMEKKKLATRKTQKRTKRPLETIRFYTIIIASFIIFILLLFFIGRQYLSFDVQVGSGNLLNAGTQAENKIDLNVLNSPYAILIDADTGAVIAQRNSDERIYPASLTKIMTALIAIEHTDNLNQSVTVPYDFFQQLYEEEASMAGFEPGERVKAKDLLYGVLLPSGAECCMTFAENISGSESAFVKLMNEKANQIGLQNTHFTNCTGLHDRNHTSSVKDIAVLLQYALKNQAFYQVFTSRYYSIPPTNQHPEGFTFYSTVFQNQAVETIHNGELLGGKTGYTEQAGQCLASLATINGKQYLLVTAGANGSPQTEPLHILDAVNVYNQLGSLT